MNAIECPNCGAIHEPDNPGIVVIVCDRCDSTLYREDDVVRQGVASVVGEPRSHIEVHAEGRVGGVGVRVIGRARLEHETGSWDEWYVRTADGRERWLIEDEKRYAFEDQIELPAGLHAGMDLGDSVEFDGSTFEVRERGAARCVGGEGQLPRAIQPGEIYYFLDMVAIGESRVLTAEFDSDGHGEAFVGEVVPPESIEFADSGRVPASEAATASTISCQGCGAPFPLPEQGDAAKTAACPNCSAVLQLKGAEGMVLGYNQEVPGFELEIGATGELLESTWEVVGRMAYVDYEGYPTFEYLLWSRDNGYLWLEYDSGHWTWSRPMEVGLPLDSLRGTSQGSRIDVGGERYQLCGRGVSQLVYVDGALPWLAIIGDQQKFFDLSAPPRLVSAEMGENELELFEGEWLPHGTVEAAFGISKGPRPWSVHFAQPNRWAGWRLTAVAAGLIFALNILIFVLAMMWPGSEIARFTIPASATGTQFVESMPFNLNPMAGPVIGVQFDTQVDNSWVYVDLALQDANTTEELGFVGEELEYYSGYDDGSWTEGSRSSTKWLKIPDEGTYVLAGTLEYDRPTDVTVTIVQGGMLARYNCCVGFPFLGFAILVFFAYFRFENQRLEDA